MKYIFFPFYWLGYVGVAAVKSITERPKDDDYWVGVSVGALVAICLSCWGYAVFR